MSNLNKSYRLVVPAEFASFNLGEDDNLYLYGRTCDNYPDSLGNVQVFGKYPQEVRPSEAFWMRELKPGTQPNDHEYTGEWDLISEAEFKEKYAESEPDPALSPAGFKAGDRIMYLQRYPGTLVRQSDRKNLTAEWWFIDFDDKQHADESFPARDLQKLKV